MHGVMSIMSPMCVCTYEIGMSVTTFVLKQCFSLFMCPVSVSGIFDLKPNINQLSQVTRAYISTDTKLTLKRNVTDTTFPLQLEFYIVHIRFFVKLIHWPDAEFKSTIPKNYNIDLSVF